MRRTDSNYIIHPLTGGILWLLPKVHGLLAGPKVFAASVYNGADYVFNAADARLTLVNANLPYAAEPAPLLDTADETTGQQLEAEAAMQYRSMAAAAQADGISLTLVAGYQDADTRQAAYEARVQTYRDKRKSEEEAARLAATIQPAANANEHGTGYAADILSADDPQQDTSFAETRAYEWLTAYAAEYGFILRYPQDRQDLEAGSQERCTPGAMRVRSNDSSLLSAPQHRAFDSVCPLQGDELFQAQAAGADGKGVFHPYIAPVPRLEHDAGQYGRRRAGRRHQPDPCGRLSGRRHPAGCL